MSAPVAPIGAAASAAVQIPDAASLLGVRPAVSGAGPEAFGQLLMNGVEHVNRKVLDAEKLTTEFALDDSIPLHQVTFALQEARASMQFMLQVRSRLLEAYQQFANIQL